MSHGTMLSDIVKLFLFDHLINSSVMSTLQLTSRFLAVNSTCIFIFYEQTYFNERQSYCPWQKVPPHMQIRIESVQRKQNYRITISCIWYKLSHKTNSSFEFCILITLFFGNNSIFYCANSFSACLLVTHDVFLCV
jgi:hypothetical protein